MKEIILELVNSPEIVKLLVWLIMTGILIGGVLYWGNKREFVQFAIALIIFLIIVEVGRYNYYPYNYDRNTITPVVFIFINTIVFIVAMFLGVIVSRYARHKERGSIDFEKALLSGNEIINQYLKDNDSSSDNNPQITLDAIYQLSQLQ